MEARTAEALSATEAGATAEALAQPTLCAAFRLTAERRPEQVALRTADGSLEITWAQYAERAGRIAAGLATLGLGHGDTLALLLTNRPEFHLVDTAAMHLGAVPFSVYNSSTAEQIAYVVGNAGSRVIVTERAMLDRVLAVRDAGATAVDHVVVVEAQGGGTADGVLDLHALEAAGEEGFDLDARWRAVGPKDLLTLIYTSGTTGPPKGVEITHANMLAEWNACRSVFPDAAGGRAVSFLPAAHIADRWSSHYGAMVHGLTLTCVRDPREVMAVVAQVRPTPVFGAVPARLGEGQGRAGGGRRGRPRRGAPRRRPRRDRDGTAPRAPRAGGRGGRCRARGGGGGGGAIGVRRAARAAGSRCGALLRLGRRPDPGRGARVLRGHRDPDLRALGDV